MKKKKRKAPFKKYVDFAVCILEVLRKMGGETPAEGMVRLYELHPDEREVILRYLIRDSETHKAAWDALFLIVKYHNRERTLPPQELADWHAEVLEKTRQEPKKKGRNRDGNANRNCAIAIAVSQLMTVTHLSDIGLKATRNRIKGGSLNPDCNSKGGSACDAVGKAVWRVYKESLGYKCIERIWTERASIGIDLESIPSITFGVLSPRDAVDLVL